MSYFPTRLYCDNKMLFILPRTLYFMRERIIYGKNTWEITVQFICNKLDMYNLYTSLWVGMLGNNISDQSSSCINIRHKSASITLYFSLPQNLTTKFKVRLLENKWKLELDPMRECTWFVDAVGSKIEGLKEFHSVIVCYVCRHFLEWGAQHVQLYTATWGRVLEWQHNNFSLGYFCSFSWFQKYNREEREMIFALWLSINPKSYYPPKWILYFLHSNGCDVLN